MLMSNDWVISLMDEISWGINTFFRHYVYCHVWEPSRVCRRYGTMTREIWPLIKQLLHGYNSLISMTLLGRQCEVYDCIVSPFQLINLISYRYCTDQVSDPTPWYWTWQSYWLLICEIRCRLSSVKIPIDMILSLLFYETSNLSKQGLQSVAWKKNDKIQIIIFFQLFLRND